MKIKHALGFLMTFMGGFVTALNMVKLYGPDVSNYEASWVKVGISVVIAVGGTFVSCRKWI